MQRAILSLFLSLLVMAMSFSYYRSVTIDHTKCGSVNSTDFPVTFNTTHADFKTVGNGGHVQNANGYDIAFFSDSGLTSALSFELERYNASTGEVIIHFKVGTLDVSSDVVVYIAYGDSGISTNQSSTATWNSGFKVVYHCNDNAANTTVLDSTSNANHGTASTDTSGLSGTGKIGLGLAFNGTNQKVSIPDFIASDYSVSVWSSPSALSAAQVPIVCWDNFNTTPRNAILFKARNGTNNQNFEIHRSTGGSTVGPSTSVGVFHYYAAHRSGTTVTPYADNAAQTAITVSSGSVTFENGRIGSHFFSGSDGEWGSVTADEVRVSNVSRGSSWALAEYNNQNSPSTFYTLGSEISIGITFDATFSSGDVAAASSWSGSVSWNGSNRGLAIDVPMLGPGVNVTAMTYGGANCSFIGSRASVTSFGAVEQWRIVQGDPAAPAAGANTLAVTLSGAIEFAVIGESLTGVHQSVPVEGFNSAQATNGAGATDASVVITSIANKCLIHAAVVASDTSIVAGQTTRNNVSGTLGSGADEDSGIISPAGATTMSYTGVGAFATWVIAGYAWRPLSASGDTLWAQSSM